VDRIRAAIFLDVNELRSAVICKRAVIKSSSGGFPAWSPTRMQLFLRPRWGGCARWRYAYQAKASSSRKSRSVSFGFSSIAFNPEGEDFAERCLYSRDQPVIVWLRIGNTSNQALLRWFVLPEILRRIELKTQ
jgi:hypothetical protein